MEQFHRPSGRRGVCLQHENPARDRSAERVGLVGVEQDAWDVWLVDACPRVCFGRVRTRACSCRRSIAVVASNHHHRTSAPTAPVQTIGNRFDEHAPPHFVAAHRPKRAKKVFERQAEAYSQSSCCPCSTPLKSTSIPVHHVAMPQSSNKTADDTRGLRSTSDLFRM